MNNLKFMVKEELSMRKVWDLITVLSKQNNVDEYSLTFFLLYLHSNYVITQNILN
jgi:hypothetical protein